MARVVVGMTMSLDGFVRDRYGSLGQLYPDMDAMRNSETVQEAIRTTGAVVMGRNAFDMANGDFTGYEFQTPIFVLTHNPPEQITSGQNDQLTITFVTDGIERAIERARSAAGDKDVTVIGGASTIQQCLNAGLADELDVAIAPVLLGAGLRFFEHLDTEKLELKRIRVTESPTTTDLRFRVVRRDPIST